MNDSPAKPPSRDSNPFATCWTRPGALPYLTGSTATPSEVVRKLERSGWRGQVVGAHGSGKSTLMHALADALENDGTTVVRLDAGSCLGPLADPSPLAVLIIEGFERLEAKDRRRSLRGLAKSKSRYLLTTHRPMRGWHAPSAVAWLRPDAALLGELFTKLTAERLTPVTLHDARRSHRLRRGNLREVWFDLYDLHERLTRPNRTAAVTCSYSYPVAVGRSFTGIDSKPARCLLLAPTCLPALRGLIVKVATTGICVQLGVPLKRRVACRWVCKVDRHNG